MAPFPAAESLPPITQLRRLGNADASGRRWPRASEPQAAAVAGPGGAVSRWRQEPGPGLKGTGIKARRVLCARRARSLPVSSLANH